MSWGLSGGVTVGGRVAKSGVGQSRKQDHHCVRGARHGAGAEDPRVQRVAQLGEEFEAHEQRVKASHLDPERQ
eukprot:2567578-Rhodomonas_salina.1